MNADQRKFLIKQVEDSCREQVDTLKESISEKPSLNNYIVAAFLDNTIQFADIEILKKKMRNTVLKMGKGEILVNSESSWRRNHDDEKEMVNVDPYDLFVIPQAYIEAMKEWESKNNAIQEKIKQLENTSKTIILKLQLGSSEILDKLIMQVDNMGDLNLVNSSLLLDSSTPLKITKKGKNSE